MRKKLVNVLLFLLALALLLSACGGQAPAVTEAPTTTQAAATTQAQAATTTTTEAAPEQKETIVFTMFCNNNLTYTTDPWDSPIGKLLTELLGVRFEMEWTVGSDFRQRAAIIIAGGDLPDFVNPNEAIGEFYAADCFIDLDDYVANSVNIKNRYREMEFSLMRNNQFGKIKGLLSGRPGVPVLRPGAGYYLCVDLLEQAGWPQPRYLDEYFDLIKNYVEANPEYNGAKTVGFTVPTQGTRASPIQYGGARYLHGHPNDGVTAVDWDTLEGKLIMNQPWYKDWCKFYFDLNQAGLLDPELFMQTDDQFKEKIASGVVVGYYDGRNSDIFGAMEQAGLDDRMPVAFPITFRGIETERYNGPLGFSTQSIIGITNKCKNPERAFQLLDDWMSDDVQKLIKWGVEGEDWVYVDGVMERTPEMWQVRLDDPNYNRMRGIGEFGFMNNLDGSGIAEYSRFRDGNLSEPNASDGRKQFEFKPYEKKIMEAYGWSDLNGMFNPQYEPRHDPGWAIRNNMPIEDLETGRQATEDALTETIQSLPKIVLAKDEAAFESEYQAFQDRLARLPLDKYERTATQMLRDSYPFYHNGEEFKVP